jgi:hypothetical protein
MLLGAKGYGKKQGRLYKHFCWSLVGGLLVFHMFSISRTDKHIFLTRPRKIDGVRDDFSFLRYLFSSPRRAHSLAVRRM